jgi:hypothetical protein
MEDAATATTRLRMTARWISQSAYQRVQRYRRNAENVHGHGWGLAENLMQDLRCGDKLKDRIARDHGVARDDRVAGNYVIKRVEYA